jgi:hypothetical protein
MMRAALIAFVLFLGAITHAADAKTRIAVLPPDAAANAEPMFKMIGESVRLLGRGDQLIVYSARPIRQIARIALPTDQSLNAARVNADLGTQLRPVREFFATMPPGLAGEPPGQLGLPTLMEELGRNVLSALPDRDTDVLIIGSLLHFDRKDSRVSMTDRYVPSDGTLRAPRTEWPFSIIGVEERLQGAVIHLCAVHAATEFESTEHSERVKRFWTLWFTGQGAKVGTISSDPGLCWRRFNAGESKGQPTYQMSRDPKAEMLRVPAPTAAVLPVNLDQPGAWFMRDDVPIATTPPTNTKGILWVGARWSGTCDVDLYGRGEPSAPWLYFGSSRTNEGLFNKDFTSGTGDAQYEFIEFTREVEIGKAEIAVNLYACDAGSPPEPILRAWFGGKVFQTSLRFGAKTGNRGAPPMSGPHWVRVDLRKVLGLKE